MALSIVKKRHMTEEIIAKLDQAKSPDRGRQFGPGRREDDRGEGYGLLPVGSEVGVAP